MKKISILNFVIVHILISKLVNCEIPKTVVTKSGPIEGVQYVEPYTKKNLLEFRKIPFAMPPVGKRRFKHAIPYGKWILKLDATKFGPSCYQTLKNSALFLPTRDVSENCLFLNIYVPNNVSASNNYSIMVWFHGGDFTGGQGTSFNGALLAAIGDVIVVTINYRLGLFGFLSTGDKHAPGNLGLGDQVVAIHWIHRYIKDYGGNPKSITLFGQSSGAMSISFLSRKSSGMFQRIILQSGFATSPLSNARNTVKNTLLLAKQVECFQNTTKETMNCLRNKTSDQLQEGFKRLKHSVQNSLNLPMFGPVRLPRNMSHIFSNSHSYRNVDVLIGNVANEGTLFLNFVKSFENFQRDDEAQKHICRHTVQMMLVLLFNTSHNLDTKVCTEYVKTEGKSSYLLDLYGDLMFNVPTYSALKSHSEQGGLGRTFQYILNINTSILHASKLPSWVQSPTHGDDVLFLSGQLVDLSKSLKNLTITMMLYWTNFAKTGDVNSRGLTYWPEYDTTNKSYAVLEEDVIVKQNLYKDRVEFWLETVPHLLTQTTNTKTDKTTDKTTETATTDKTTDKTTKTVTTDRTLDTTTPEQKISEATVRTSSTTNEPRDDENDADILKNSSFTIMVLLLYQRLSSP